MGFKHSWLETFFQTNLPVSWWVKTAEHRVAEVPIYPLNMRLIFSPEFSSVKTIIIEIFFNISLICLFSDWNFIHPLIIYYRLETGKNDFFYIVTLWAGPSPPFGKIVVANSNAHQENWKKIEFFSISFFVFIITQIGKFSVGISGALTSLSLQIEYVLRDQEWNSGCANCTS